jgi:hemoglobin
MVGQDLAATGKIDITLRCQSQPLWPSQPLSCARPPARKFASPDWQKPITCVPDLNSVPSCYRQELLTEFSQLDARRTNMAEISLYDRLGGAKGLAQIVEDTFAAHLNNPVVKTRFEIVKDLENVKKMAREFFGAGSGGPETYTGKDMMAAHKGMNISEQEYLAVMDDVLEALSKNKVGEDAVKDVIAILYSLKGQIIRS